MTVTTLFGVVMFRSMYRQTVTTCGHVTQGHFFLKATGATTITSLCLTDRTSTLDCLSRVVSFPFLCCYQLNSFRYYFSCTLTIGSTCCRTFMLIRVITAMFNEAILTPHYTNTAYAVETCALPAGAELRQMFCLHLCPII